MSGRILTLLTEAELRSRAASHLSSGRDAHDGHRSAVAAMGVLHGLATSPATAADALALLHELQVHQVELDLQREELLQSSLGLERELSRQVQLYDFAPVGLFSLNPAGEILELNLYGAKLLGGARERLLGHNLNNYLSPDSADRLRQMLEAAASVGDDASCALDLRASVERGRALRACVGRDPSGQGILLALMPTGD